MSIQQIQSEGIYHGLPVYSSDLSGLTAIITGANGISGHYMLRALARDSKRWKRIICLSRRPPLIPGGLPPNAEHISLDFLTSPQEIASTLTQHNATANHIFFYSYIQPPPKPNTPGIWSDATELCRINTLLLSNFLSALDLANIHPQRFMLQTGAKNYGGHLGPTTLPQEESDPRVTLEPNFYYPQEDTLWQWCKERSPHVAWTIHMPGPILGAVPDAAMNAAFPLAVYCAVTKRLGATCLEFPGDVASWQMGQSMSSAMLNALQEEWGVLLGPENQKYNTCDDSVFAWEKAWGRVAGWYGLESRPPQEGETSEEVFSRFLPRGYGPRGVTRRRFSMVQWAKREDVRRAWGELAVENGLVQKELVDVERVFGFLDGTLCRPAPLSMSMDKSRKLGWHGFVDSTESLLHVFRDLAKIKMIPPVPEVTVSFN